ncbi:hypothetical protein CTAYLR_009540 [Chrysophaeum taylorii]|uniref:rRNA methyltransferase 1, mitochondrial n=1 Tax=Chrysophaeum taylorii TaxID=2483200 RepID=A0AAD7UEN9_9STRA|nr:hypothetical protein CTAYLR_009540 [Chrysophaeum taylorii]
MLRLAVVVRALSAYNAPRHKAYVRREREPRPWDKFVGAEFVYGVSPVHSALRSNRRKIHSLFTESDPPLEIAGLCEELGVPIVAQPKGRLQEAISQPRAVHQGLALCCEALEFELLESAAANNGRNMWLALDEVQDPRNFGAILRSARFFGVPVVSCAKNSAPLSPVASKASAGAMEEVVVYEARNLVKFLAKSKENGFRVLGASLSKGKTDHRVLALRDVDVDVPTIVVLGSEGTGLRTNVLFATSLPSTP